MANLFVVIPTLVGNGSGAAVDVSGMGESKTITVGSGGGVYTPTVMIEVALDAAGVNWSPLCAFQGKGQRTIDVACHWMRATTSSFVDGTAPVVGVGGSADAPSFATLVATAATGFGAGVVTSAMGPFKTIQVTGAFKGVVNIQASEDGGVTYSTIASFIGPGQISRLFTADHMRVHRDGVPQVAPGLPVITVAGSIVGSSGGAPQRFTYVATGAEGNTFLVPLPAARPNVNYLAQVTGGGLNGDFLLFDVPVAQNTVNSIRVLSSAPMVAGYVLAITVEDLS